MATQHQWKDGIQLRSITAGIPLRLLVVAGGLYRILAKRMRGYPDAQARQIFRHLIDMPADVTITDREVEISFHRRAHLPIILDSGLIDQPVSVLEKNMSSNSTPEQLVGSLADRTPDVQGHPNVHHLQILRAELSRQFDLAQIVGRVVLRDPN